MNSFQQKYKYNSFLEYSDELEKIILEKGYSTDIADLIRLTFPVMIEYYGHEYKNIFFKMLKEVNIEIPEDDKNMYDIVQKYTPTNIKKKSNISAVNDGDLRRADGVYSSNPIFEVVEGRVVLVGKTEVVAVNKSNNLLEMVSGFVHEASHALKSTQNTMLLIDDEQGNQILVTRNGLNETYSKVYIEDGMIVVEDIKEINVGLEEGINTYDENNIVNNILALSENEIPENCRHLRAALKLPNEKTKYTSSGYVQETLLAEDLLVKCELEQIVRQDQFLGTTNCEEQYDSITKNKENTWKKLNSKMDTAVRHTYDRYKNIFNPKWIEEHINEIIDNLRDINLMLEECAISKKSIDLEK